MGVLAYRATCAALRVLLGYTSRIQIDLPEGLPEPPFLFACNHISHFDPPILSARLPFQIDWLADVELFRHPLGRAYFRSVNAFPVDRKAPGRESIRSAVERLHSGAVVGIFPEGGIRHEASSVLGGAAIKPGVSVIARLAGVPIVPGVILGSDRLYDPAAWRRWRSVPVWVRVGRPLERQSSAKDSKEGAERALADAMRKLSGEIVEMHRLGGEDLPADPKRRMAGYGRCR